MNEELEEALDILNAAINNDRYLLNDNQIRTLIDLRNRLLHCNEFSSSDKDRGLFSSLLRECMRLDNWIAVRKN